MIATAQVDYQKFGGRQMDIWNVWTALATGLVIGTSIGMILAALLTISSTDEPQQPKARKHTIDDLHVTALQRDNAVVPPEL